MVWRERFELQFDVCARSSDDSPTVLLCLAANVSHTVSLLPFLQEHILQDKGAGLYMATTYIKFNKRFTQAGERDGDSVDTAE